MSMSGMELAKAYYKEFGEKMLEEQFSEYKDRIAVGLVGHGSECFGFDDEISKDHDFEPGFCLWLTEEDKRLFGFKLFRAYSKLPKEFMGVKIENTSLFGSEFKGVHSINEFYSFYLPEGKVPQTLDEWLNIPDYYLAEATNGEIFCDSLGEFSAIREEIKKGYPEDVRLKKLASAVFNMAQSGQYNYSRCMAHGERSAAALALSKFAENAAHAVFLINRQYMPYYKWSFRAMRALPILGNIENEIKKILEQPYNAEINVPIVEGICSAVAEKLRDKALSDQTGDYLEPYAYCIKNKISDSALRNSPVMI